MPAAWMIGALLAVASAPADTVVAVRTGESLRVETRTGSVSVRTWGRDEVRLDDRPGLALRRENGVVRVTNTRRWEHDAAVEATLTIPRWMDVMVDGHEVHVEVADTEGRVEIRTVEGDLTLRSTRGGVAAYTVDGHIDATDVAGTVELRVIDGGVRVEGARGRLRAETTDGDLVLTGLEVDELVAETLDGAIDVEARRAWRGSWRVATHDGDVRVSVPRNADARVSVSTFDGSFRPEIPVRATTLRAGQAVRFTLGEGRGSLDIQAFDGDIRLGWTGSGG